MNIFYWQSSICFVLAGWSVHLMLDRPVMVLVALTSYGVGVLAMDQARRSTSASAVNALSSSAALVIEYSNDLSKQHETLVTLMQNAAQDAQWMSSTIRSNEQRLKVAVDRFTGTLTGGSRQLWVLPAT